MNGTPTIILASLSDDKLKESINSLVKHVNEKMEEMVESTNSAVKRMEDKLKSLGSLKIDSGGTNDGGAGRRTQQHEKLTKAVNDASEAVSKETQKLQDLQQSLSGASDREQNFISQKERAANTIAQENELLQRQEQELANLKNQQSSFSGTNQQTTASIDKQRESIANLKNEVKYWQSIVSQLQSGDKKARFNSLWIGDTTSKQGHDILDVANKLYSIMQKLGMETEKGSASTGQAVKVVEQLAKYYKISREEAEKLVMSVQESPLARGKFTTHYDTRFGLDNLTMQKKDAEDSALRLMIAQSKLERQTDDLALANKRLVDSENSSTQSSQQKAQIDAQVAAKEKEIAETKGRIAAATKEQSEADKNATQAAKEKANIQSQVANQEKQVAEAKKQLTTATQQHTDAETKSSRATKEKSMTLDQQASAINTAVQSSQRYTSILKEQQSELERLKLQKQSLLKTEGVSTKPNDEISKRIERLNQQLEEAKTRLQGLKSLSVISIDSDTRRDFTEGIIREAKRLKSTLDMSKMSLEEMLKLPSTGNEKLDKYIEGVRRLMGAWNSESIKLAEERITSLKREIDSLNSKKGAEQTSTNNSQKIAQIDSQIAAKEKEIAETKEKIASITQQTINSTNANIASAQRYTEEIRKQAAAIRETQTWKEKGYAIVDGNVYHDPERSNIAKRNRISLEEQIVQRMQEQQTAEGSLLRTEQERVEAIKVARDGYAATNEQLEKARQLSNKGFGTTIGEKYGSVPTFTTQLESANALSKRLKELKEQYNSLSYGKRLSAEGQAIALQIREITRQGQKLSNELNRPTKKEVFGLSEKTLDDIAYKMRQLSTYRSGLDVSKQTQEVTQVNDEYNRLKKRMDEVMQKNQQMIASNTALGRSWNYMKNRLAFYFTVGASTQFVKNLIEVRSQYEMNERALGILINSAERGTQIFNELSQMALVSPYTLIELSSAAKQLTAYDIAAKDVVNTTRRLADMAAAVGIPIERLTYALGQVKAYGYLNARDARMFANAGIPLVKNLSEYYTELEGRLVSTADIYDRIKKKQIGYEEVMSTISKMTDEGGKFFDFQAKMAETLKVQLANLTLAWNNMLNDMGEESQGVIVGGIGALKQMFMHWKDIEHILTEVVVALGAYKAYQLVTTRLMGATSASLDAQILAMKRNNAAMLEKQSLTRKLTYDEAKLIATQNQLTAADYKNALSGKNLTKQKALLLVALNKNNVQLKAAIVNMGLLTAQEAANVTTGRALAIVFKSIGISIRNAAMAMKAFMVSNWWMFALGGIYELYHAWDSYNEHVAEINRSAAEHAKEAYENIRQYLEGDVISALQDNLAKGGKVSSDAEGQKAWDEMREKIELSSSASNVFIARLMQIDDINERLSAGFGYLEDIQRVAGVMQTLGDDAIKVSTTTLGGLFGEGLKDDLNDFVDAYQKYVNLNENLRQSGVGEEYFNEQKRALEEFRSEVEKTTESLYNIASREGFNRNEQREFFERGISETAQAEQMGIKETRIYRMQAEQEYYAYAKAQLEEQLQYQQGEQKAATERRLQELQNEFGTNKAMQESFFTWLTEKQDHAVKNMLRGKTQEEIKQGDWLKGANGKWVEEMARKFSQEYGVSFDDLHRLVMNANTWSINIPVFFQTIGQPLTDVQRDYEARTGKKFSSNYLIKDAKSQVEILDILKKRQKEVANEMETARKAGDKYWENNKERLKEENDALIADIHAYNALTDAEEKANKKSGKGGSKKDPLLDALKQEISLVEKLQSDYDKLSKSGASQADALDTIRGAYGKTIRLLNTQLQSYGLPQIDISKLITGKDPHKSLEHFKQTLDTLVSKGLLTIERSKEIEAVIEKFTLSAKTYDLDMITKGLNSKLDRLKEEYELAVALDADPELGSIFADWMGIDMDNLPRTAEEYAKRYTDILNKKMKERKADIELPNLLNITDDDLRELQNLVGTGGITQTYVDEITKAVKDVRGVFKKEKEDTSKEWNALIEKYGGLQAKILKIYKDTVQQQTSIVKQFGSDKQISQALDLVRNIQISQDPADIARLQEELAKIINDIIKNNPIALKTYQATQKEQKSNESKAYWEDFKESDLYTMTFEDMANNSTRAIQLIIDKLNELKFKVKEDPASMKALIKSLNEAESELNVRDPFSGIIKSIKAMSEASRDAKEAKEELAQADIDVSNAQKAVDYEKQNGSARSLYEAEQQLTNATNRRTTARKNLTNAENRGKKAEKSLKESVNATIDVFNNISKAVDGAAEVFRIFGDNDTADAISEINKGFSAMTTIIMGVFMALMLLKATNPWLLAISAALGVIVGLVSFLSGNSNKKITEQVEESERAVKRLENAYRELEFAANNAYGTAVSGANQAMKANKELQLVELKRQLALEQSRSSKNKDEDKIIDLTGQIIDLENEISKATSDTLNNLLGISSHGDFFEDMISEMISAFKNGEDAMKVFEEKWADMIDNMIMKTIVSQVLQNWVDSLEDGAQKILDKFTAEPSKAVADLTKQMTDIYSQDAGDISEWIYDNDRAAFNEILKSLGVASPNFMRQDRGEWFDAAWDTGLAKQIQDIYIANMESRLDDLSTQLDKASLDATGDLIDYYSMAGEDFKANYLDVILGKIKENWNFGQDSENKLSQLQQGIQSVSETTASALEAYMNSVNQQVYLHSELLTQIRDAIMGTNSDIQLGVQGQMLLQLQNNYIIMQSIQSMMEGWTTPSGQGIRVELIS